MSSKEEIAALMASEANYEQKIVLLKKAVVNVTKQKQAMEQQRDDLAKKLRESEAARNGLQDEIAALRCRLGQLELEVQKERQQSKGTKFSHHVLKGISSFMTGAESGGSSSSNNSNIRAGVAIATTHPVAREHRSQQTTSKAAVPAGNAIALTAADIEHVVAENAELHRRIFDAETACEEATRAGQAESMRLSVQLAEEQTEMTELRGLLDAATQACDEANGRRDYYAALAEFCRNCFVLRWRAMHSSAASTRHMQATTPAVHAEEDLAARNDLCETETTHNGTNLVTRMTRALAHTPVISLRTPIPYTVPSSSHSSSSVATAAEWALVQLTLRRFNDTIRTLVRGVTVLMIGLAESLPRQLHHRATLTRRRLYEDKLSHLRGAHKHRGDGVLHALHAIDDVVIDGMAELQASEAESQGKSAGRDLTRTGPSPGSENAHDSNSSNSNNSSDNGRNDCSRDNNDKGHHNNISNDNNNSDDYSNAAACRHGSSGEEIACLKQSHVSDSARAIADQTTGSADTMHSTPTAAVSEKAIERTADVVHSTRQAPPRSNRISRLQHNLLEQAIHWVSLLRLHIPFLVELTVSTTIPAGSESFPPSDASAPHVTREHTHRQNNSSSSNNKKKNSNTDSNPTHRVRDVHAPAPSTTESGETTEARRERFVRATSRCGVEMLSRVEGCLTAMRDLLVDAHDAAVMVVCEDARDAGTGAVGATAARHVGVTDERTSPNGPNGAAHPLIDSASTRRVHTNSSTTDISCDHDGTNTRVATDESDHMGARGVRNESLSTCVRLLALQFFLCDGAHASFALRSAVEGLIVYLESMSRHCEHTEVRNAWRYLIRCLTRGIMSTYGETRQAVRDKAHLPNVASSAASSPSPWCRGFAVESASCVGKEELLRMLAAADRAAWGYYAQLQTSWQEAAEQEAARQLSERTLDEVRRELEAIRRQHGEGNAPDMVSSVASTV